jgi:hypothetical protein
LIRDKERSDTDGLCSGELLNVLKTAELEDKLDVEILTFKKEKKEQDNSAENKAAFDSFLEAIGDKVLQPRSSFLRLVC